MKFTTVLVLLTFALSCVLSSPAPPKTRPKNEKEVAKMSLSQAAGHIHQLATKPDNSDKNDDPRLMRDLARRIEKLEKLYTPIAYDHRGCKGVEALSNLISLAFQCSHTLCLNDL
jgi:hypothetical protein